MNDPRDAFFDLEKARQVNRLMDAAKTKGQNMNDPAVNAVHKLIHRATKAETELQAILAAFATLDHGQRVSLDQLASPLAIALVRAEGATNPDSRS